jgi:hypothetical protein
MQTLAPPYVLELAWQALLTPIVGIAAAAINTSDKATATLHPNLTITTTDIEDAVKLPNGFSTGVYKAKSRIQYECKLAQTTPQAAETQFGTIIQAFYYDQALAVRLTEAYPNFNCYAVTNFKMNQAVKQNDKLWQKSIDMDVFFMTRNDS